LAKERDLRVLITSAASVVQRVAQLLSSLITLPLVLHSLGLAGFGIWGAATSLAWIAGLLTIGFGSALVALIPRSLAAGDTAQSRAHVTGSLLGGATLAAALLLGGGAIILLTGIRVPQLPFLIAGISLVLNIPLSISAELWLALQKGHVGALWATVQTLLSLILIVLGAVAGAGVTFMTAAIYVPLLITNAGSLLHVFYLHRHLRPNRRPSTQALRDVLGQGGLFFAITAAATCASAFDNVMTLAWLGPSASAEMAVAMRVCVTATLLINAVTQPFWPGFADALAAHDIGWARRTLKAGMAAVLILALGGSACLVAVGQPVLSWWLHQNLHLSQGLLLAMGAWIIGTTISYVPGALLNAAAQLKPQILIFAAVAVIGFGFKFLAAKSFGVAGILAVNPILWLAAGPLYVWLAWRVVRTHPAGTAE
jgi:O-antigen/teichoic acid export membrane protein